MAHQHGHQYDPREAAEGEQPGPQPRRHPRSQGADPEKQRAEHQQEYSWGAERQKGEVKIRCVVLPERADGAQYASEEENTEAPLLQPPCACDLSRVLGEYARQEAEYDQHEDLTEGSVDLVWWSEGEKRVEHASERLGPGRHPRRIQRSCAVLCGEVAVAWKGKYRIPITPPTRAASPPHRTKFADSMKFSSR